MMDRKFIIKLIIVIGPILSRDEYTKVPLAEISNDVNGFIIDKTKYDLLI